jgi:hypothetical protein
MPVVIPQLDHCVTRPPSFTASTPTRGDDEGEPCAAGCPRLDSPTCPTVFWWELSGTAELRMTATSRAKATLLAATMIPPGVSRWWTGR